MKNGSYTLPFPAQFYLDVSLFFEIDGEKYKLSCDYPKIQTATYGPERAGLKTLDFLWQEYIKFKYLKGIWKFNL
jgi:hypothetical protein